MSRVARGPVAGSVVVAEHLDVARGGVGEEATVGTDLVVVVLEPGVPGLDQLFRVDTRYLAVDLTHVERDLDGCHLGRVEADLDVAVVRPLAGRLVGLAVGVRVGLVDGVGVDVGLDRHDLVALRRRDVALVAGAAGVADLHRVTVLVGLELGEAVIDAVGALATAGVVLLGQHLAVRHGPVDLLAVGVREARQGLVAVEDRDRPVDVDQGGLIHRGLLVAGAERKREHENQDERTDELLHGLGLLAPTGRLVVANRGLRTGNNGHVHLEHGLHSFLSVFLLFVVIAKEPQ